MMHMRKLTRKVDSITSPLLIKLWAHPLLHLRFSALENAFWKYTSG